MKDLIILGAGGFAREVMWLAETNGYNVVGFISENYSEHGLILNDKPVLGSFDWFDTNEYGGTVICGVGNNEVREKLVCRALEHGLEFTTLVDASVKLSKFVTIGEGSIVTANNIITTQVTIGKHVNINLSCTIGHDVVVDDFVNIAPGVNVSGNVTLSSGCDIGTGAKIIQKKKIGLNSVVGAGSVIIKDVPDNATVVGVPGKIIASNK